MAMFNGEVDEDIVIASCHNHHDLSGGRALRRKYFDWPTVRQVIVNQWINTFMRPAQWYDQWSWYSLSALWSTGLRFPP